MSTFLRYSAGGLGILLMTAYVTVSAESGVNAFRPKVIEAAPPALTMVNRTTKGDREPAARNAQTVAKTKPVTTARDQKILEGCDPAFSPLTASAKNNYANRCVV